MFNIFFIFKNILFFSIIYLYNLIINFHILIIHKFLYKIYFTYIFTVRNLVIKQVNNNNITSYIYLINNKIIIKIEDKIIYINILLAKNEKFFYKNIKDKLNSVINIPKCLINNNNILGLEYIKNNKNMNIKIILNIIYNISNLHIKFWNNTDNIFFLEENIVIKEFMNLIYKYSDLIFFSNSKLYYIFKNKAFINPIKGNTLIHGDLKPENILFKNKETIFFIDWSLYRIGLGVEDILMLIIFSINNIHFKKYFLIMLIYYFKLINKYYKYPIEIFVNDIKISLKGIIMYYMVGLEMNNFIKLKNNNAIINNYIFLLEYFHII